MMFVFNDDITFQVGMFVSNTPAWEMENSKLAVTSTLIFNTLVLVAFSIIATIRADNAKSKPLIGFGGLVSATLATVMSIKFIVIIFFPIQNRIYVH